MCLSQRVLFDLVFDSLQKHVLELDTNKKNSIGTDCVFCYADLADFIHFCYSIRIETACEIFYSKLISIDHLIEEFCSEIYPFILK